jgi:hypothetical protein
MRIRNPGWRQFGSGIGEKVGYGIRDKHPGSATLTYRILIFFRCFDLTYVKKRFL